MFEKLLRYTQKQRYVIYLNAKYDLMAKMPLIIKRLHKNLASACFSWCFIFHDDRCSMNTRTFHINTGKLLSSSHMEKKVHQGRLSGGISASRNKIQDSHGAESHPLAYRIKTFYGIQSASQLTFTTPERNIVVLIK